MRFKPAWPFICRGRRNYCSFQVVKVRQPKPRTKRTLEWLQKISGEEMMWRMIAGSGPKTEKTNLLRENWWRWPIAFSGFLSEKGVWQGKTGQKNDFPSRDSENGSGSDGVRRF